MAAQEKLIGLKAIESYLDVQLDEVRRKIKILEDENRGQGLMYGIQDTDISYERI